MAEKNLNSDMDTSGLRAGRLSRRSILKYSLQGAGAVATGSLLTTLPGSGSVFAAGAASDELAAALKDHRGPAVWTAVVHTCSAAGKESIEALICFARDEHSMRDALAERVGSHVANVAAVVRGIGANEVTHGVITPDALRMAEELIRRREPFSLEARLEYYQR